MRTDLAGTGPWVSTTGHPFTAGFKSGTDAWTHASCGAHLAKTEHLWWVTTITDPCFPHAFHSSDQTFQPIKGLWESMRCSSRHTLFHALWWSSVFSPALQMCAPWGSIFLYVFCFLCTWTTIHLDYLHFPSLVLLLVLHLHLSTGSSLCLTMSVVSSIWILAHFLT